MNKKALFWSFIIILTSSYIVNTRLNTDFIGSSSLDVPCQFGTYIESSGETYYCHSDHLLYKTHRIGYDGHDAENKTICLGCLRWSGTSDGVHEIYSVETVDINGTVYAEIGVSLPEQERGKNLSYGSRLRNPDEFTTYSEVSRSIVVDTTTPLLYVPLPHDIESVFLVVGPNSTTIKLQNDSGIPHDTYVDGYNPSYENGQKSTFSVRLNISSPTRENWPVLAFNMSQVPTGQVPTEALLELYLISEDLDFNEYNSITAYPLPCDGSWNVTGNSPIEGDSSGVPADNATGEISKNTMAVGSQFLNQSGCGHIQIDNGGAGLYYNLTLTQCISDAWNAGCTDLAWVYLIDFNGSAGGADEGNYGASEWTTSSQRVALWLTYATPTLSCGIYDSCVQLTSDNNTDDAFARDAAKTTEYDCDDTIATYNHMYMHRPFSTADARGFTRWDISNIPDTGSLYNASLRWKVDSNQLESGECFPIWIYLINDSGWQPDGSVVTEGGSCGNAAEAGDFEWQDAYFNGSTGEITETEGYYLLNHTRCGEYNISYAEANAGDWINFDVSECLRQSIAAGLDNMTLGMYTPTGTVDGANWCGATSGDAIYFASSEDSDTTIRPVLNTYWNEPLISYLSVDFGEPYTDELSPTTKSLWKFTPSASHAVTNCTLWENITGGGFVERNSTTSVTNGSENIIYFNDTDGVTRSY